MPYVASRVRPKTRLFKACICNSINTGKASSISHRQAGGCERRRNVRQLHLCSAYSGIDTAGTGAAREMSFAASAPTRTLLIRGQRTSWTTVVFRVRKILSAEDLRPGSAAMRHRTSDGMIPK
jgi:hypothetical protein